MPSMPPHEYHRPERPTAPTELTGWAVDPFSGRSSPNESSVWAAEADHLQPLPSGADDLLPAIAQWAQSPALGRLVAAFGGFLPPNDDVGEMLGWLDVFSRQWDFRAGGERQLAVVVEIPPDLETIVTRAAHELGLVGPFGPPASRYDHVLILGGLVGACFARPLYAARLLCVGGKGVATASSSVTALGAYRRLMVSELELATSLGRGDVTDEFEAMDAGVRAAFHLGEPVDDSGVKSEVVGAAWRLRGYLTSSGLPVHVVAAPSSAPGQRRANTADTYRWFAKECAQLSSGQRILLVTTDIYARYQHADALRMLALPYSVEVDVVGMRPGDVDRRLTQEFGPHHYLQEIRSTIRALRALHQALATPVARATARSA